MTCNKVRVRDKSIGRLSGLFEYMRSTNFDAQSLDGLGNGGKMQPQSNLQIDNGGKRSGIRTYPNNIRTSDPHIATKWISRTKLGDQFSSYRMICNKAIDNMLDDQDKKEPLCMTFCSKLMLMFSPPCFSFCSCCFLRVDFKFVANQVKARGLY